ncbi:probable 2-oxoglutarate-dependent dioxygenase At5g05600 [Zea mays]|uniref:Fe2OG dioxygenase domain-containing protein n=2 Tax=Zea mays TaxID=4577 RepID=A0A804M167_MAIZE|nr:probable 2-oxoglutarate-dependent dioxygenase At5g05600 [Zea mays]|eukprot:XP_008665133.1 probable 2-oxoglutarate-dependent dioxygenase At5g05600 [Zea mays]
MDDAFVQAIEYRPVSPIPQATGIPVVDLSPLARMPPSPGAMNALAAGVGAACRDWGFFLAVGHGVPDATVARAVEAGRAFFALPPERKAAVRRTEQAPLGYYDAEHTKNVRDWKEVFDVFPHEPRSLAGAADDELVFVNKWPDDSELPGFRAALEEYAAAMEELALKLLELIARSLHLRPDRLHGFFGDDQTTYMRVNRYPPCPRPDLALGLGRHKDSGALTILLQDDDVGGLEVRRRTDGEWVRVEPVRGSFVVNVGDIVQVWSNDRYESVEHRASVNSEKERFSIPYFFNPAMATLVEPLEEMVSEENPARYASYSWGDFFRTRRRSNFRKLDVDNIQIAQLRKDK